MTMLSSLKDNNWFGMRLKRARESARLSQEELAERVDLTRLTIARYETGRLKPGFERLHPIAQAVSQPLWWFFTDDDEEPIRELALPNDVVGEFSGRLARMEEQLLQCRAMLSDLSRAQGR